MKAVFKCIIKIVSPVNIGCGEVYEPTGFIVDEDKKCLVQFEPSEFIAGLDNREKEQLSAVCCEGSVLSILKLYKFFHGKNARGRKINLSQGFLDHYRACLKIPGNNNASRVQRELNRFIIERTAFRTWDNRPYIPGSSIKGSFRTGYLNYLCKGRKVNAGHKEIEKELMGYKNIEEDPFGRVQVSDFQPVGDVKTKIIYAVNKKKKISDKAARGPYQILEVIEPGAVFTGEISVMDTHAKTKVKNFVTLNSLINGAGSFYKKEHERENQELSRINIPEHKMTNMNTDNPILLRIGRHSGAESITISGNRNIRIMLGNRKDIHKDHATTLWLVSSERKSRSNSELMPFGWSVIEPVSCEQEEQMTADENNYAASFARAAEKHLKREKHRIQMLKEARQKQEKEKAEKKKKLEQEKLEAAQKKAAIEAMTPEERERAEKEQMLSEIFDSKNVVENKVVELFNGLDDMEPDLKFKTAERIKGYYQKHGKWKVNKKKKKQFAKVNKLKSILDKV